MAEKRSILSIFAHPDDESYGVGGTLAKYHHEGVRLILITLTDGGSGSKRLQPGILPDAPLGECRLKELEMACAALGVDRLISLGYEDGKLNVADKDIIRDKICAIIVEERPDIMLTFHPNGISGHQDHIVAAEMAREAFIMAARPETPSSHQVKKFYYHCMAEKVAALLTRRYHRRFYGLKDEEITTVIDTSAYKEKRLEALRCHQTQFSPEVEGPDTMAARFTKELYQRYFPVPSFNAPKENDLFQEISVGC